MIFLIFILLAVCIALTPVSVFVMDIPVFLMVVIPITLCICLIYYIYKVKRKRWKKVVISLLTCLGVIFALFGAFFNPYTNSVSFRDINSVAEYDAKLDKEAAMNDLEYLIKKVKKVHPLCIDEIPDNVMQSYTKALNDITNRQSLTTIELYYMVQQILSPLSDAHTCCYFGDKNPHYFKYLWEMRDKGYTINKVYGMTAKDILEERYGLFCFEVEDYALSKIKESMASLEGLRQLGFTIDESVEYTFVNEHDEHLIQSYPITDYITYEEYVAYYGEDYQDKIEEIERPFVSYEINSEKSLAILYLDMCRYNDEYIKTVEEMFVQVKALGIKNVAVDLCNNPGGSSMVVNEFIRYLNVNEYMVDTFSWRFGPTIYKNNKNKSNNPRYEQYTFDGRVFVLTSADTFSSAMMFAQYIGDNDLGTLIGETPANAANGYGEVVRFQLPNSKLVLGVSSKEFTRANPQIPSDVVEVDITCESKECMEVLYSYIDKED